MKQACAVVLLAAALLGLVLAGPALAQQSTMARCDQGISVTGLNRLLGTIWGYVTGPLGKVLAIMVGLFGLWETVFSRDRTAGIIALVVAAVIAFAGEAVNTLFTAVGTQTC